ncbi:tryptophanase [Candidatus Peregrinibacteria bacterium]|nr:tryptophanase [Candidatus Peregrinibacteria bacterium]
MHLSALIQDFPSQSTFKPSPRPYFNHSVEFKSAQTPEARAKKLDEVGLNVFSFPAEIITGCDFLSDSGTTTMTSEQWAALHLGDESYGSNRGFFKLMEAIHETFGAEFFNDPSTNQPNAFLFHQGRAAEDAIFKFIGALDDNQIIPSNGHFDTTHANIEANGMKAINLFSPELKDGNSNSHFKGNMDVSRLEKLLQEKGDKIPVIFITITNNTGGEQPVSLQNIKEVYGLSRTYKKPFFLDACRFAENAYFIKQHEEGYKEKSIKEIVHEIFSFADGFTISFKKDGLSNMGGGIFIRNNGLFIEKYPEILDGLMNYQIIKEGHPTYGGLSGRDIMALAVGLKTIVRDEYMNFRISQIQDFGSSMAEAGLPVLKPFGGHALYLDMNKFFEDTALKAGDFGGISFTALLLSAYGHRACELGYFAFGSYDSKTGEETFPEVNFVRFAVPRLRYEKQDLDHAVASVKSLYDGRDKIPPVDVIYGKELTLRHFKARFKFRNS